MYKILYILIDKKTNIFIFIVKCLEISYGNNGKSVLLHRNILLRNLAYLKLAEIFDMSIEDFLNEREQPSPVIEIKRARKKKSTKEQSIRISVPQEKVEKFKQVLLYVLAKIGAQPNIGQTALYKVLYFIDFDYYEKYEAQLIGAKYIKNTYGPSPVMFAKIVEELEKEDKIEKAKAKFHSYDQVKYLVNSKELDISSLSSQELEHINWEIRRLKDMTAAQISELSHLDTPWVVAGDREELKYEHVFYRPQLTSVREYEEL